jgi:hypothetical protein
MKVSEGVTECVCGSERERLRECECEHGIRPIGSLFMM